MRDRATGLDPDEAVPSIAPLLELPVGTRYPPLALAPDQQRKRLLATIVAWTFGRAIFPEHAFLCGRGHDAAELSLGAQPHRGPTPCRPGSVARAGYHRLATEAITRFDGHVAKYLGDGDSEDIRLRL
jgi:hypothetical protein